MIARPTKRSLALPPATRLAGVQVQVPRKRSMLPGRVAGQTKPAGVAQAMEQRDDFKEIAAKLKQEVKSTYTETEELNVSFGQYSLTAKWGASSRQGEFKGEIICTMGSTQVAGEMTFDIFAIKDAPTFVYLKKKKPEVDGGKLCAEVGNLKSFKPKSGVGSACVYVLTVIAERYGAPYIMISSSIADDFYRKVGCATFDPICNDMFGLTQTVKMQAQLHMKS